MARCVLGLCVVLAVSRIDAAGPLGLEVTVPRPAIVQGEPVVVEVRLGNVSAKPVTVDPLLAPEAGRLIWHFTSPAGTERRYRPVFLLDGEARPREITSCGRYTSLPGWSGGVRSSRGEVWGRHHSLRRKSTA